MPKRSNSDDENLSSNASSDQNDSDSDQEEVIKHSSKKKTKIESDSNDSDKSEESNDSSSEDEKNDEDDSDSKKKSKNKLNDDSSGEDDKPGSDNNSESEKSTKSNKEKSDDNKSDKSDDNEKSDDEKSDEIFSPKKKAKKIMDSDSDSDHLSELDEKIKVKAEHNEDMDDIFGEMSDEDDEDIKKPETKNENLADDDEDELIKREQNIEQDDDELNRDIFQQFEEEQQPETETRIDVTIPKINADLGKESHFVKLPNFLSVDTHPYDPSWYEDEIDDDELLDDEGRARMKLKVENTIRWRSVVDKDGNQQKESNARIIKWSDGSMSLHLGSEIFDIHKQPILGGDNNHLYIRQGTGLLGQAVFKTKLTFRPHSTDSFTHKKMTLSLADRSQKTQKIRVLPTVGLDPEANRTDRIKKEEDKLRASLRRENKVRRVRERVNQRGPTTSYLEPDMDDEDGAISLSAIKNKYKQRGQSYADVYSDNSDSASSNDSIFNKKRTTTVKKTGKIEESDED